MPNGDTTRKILRIAFLLLGAALPAAGQGGFTTVTGTVTDPNGLKYACGAITAQLITAGGASPTLNGGSFTTQTSPVSLGCPTTPGTGAPGSFVMRLADSGVIVPGTTTWKFTVNMTPGIAPPAGTGPQSFSFTTAINCGTNTPSTCTSNQMDISIPLSAGAPALSNASGTGFPVTTPVTVGSGGSITTTGTGTITATNIPSTAYSLSVSGSTITATSNGAGATVTGTDLAVVLNTAMANVSSTCGRFFFKNGIYKISSNTAGPAGAYSAITYGIGIPAAVVAGTSYCEWQFEGEAAPSFLGTSGLTSGVIWDVQSAALPGATVLFAAVFKLPDTGTTYDSTSLVFKNMAVRFPSNQRGCERAIWPREAGQVSYNNVIAWGTTGVLPGTLAPVPGSCGMVGLSTTAALKNQIQFFENTTVAGFDIPYDFSMDHNVGVSVLSQFNNTAACFACTIGGFGYGSAAQQVSSMVNFDDSTNASGVVLGAGAFQGSRLDFFGYSAEFIASPWQSRTTAAWSEANSGYTAGIIYYQILNNEIPVSKFFTSGGVNFQGFESNGNANIALTPGLDNFTRPNAASIGLPWLNYNGGICNASLSGNTAVGNAGSSVCLWSPQVINPDQFSKITVSVNALINSAVVRQNGAVLTYYDYACITGTGRELRKRVAGTFTVLGGPTGSCVAGDSMEVRVIGSNFWAYYTHTGVTTLDFVASDATITSGLPGIALGNASDTISAWSGGSFPTMHGTDSI
jgi:hypothetical protein